MRNGYETISFVMTLRVVRDKYVHSIPDATLCGALLGLISVKTVIEEVSR